MLETQLTACISQTQLQIKSRIGMLYIEPVNCIILSSASFHQLHALQAAIHHHAWCCRYGFLDNLTLGGPTPLGARAANLTEMTRPFMEEIALNEQGHALFTRQAGSTIPCPLVDFDGGFNDFMAAAYGLADGVSVADQFGSAFGKPLPSLRPMLQHCLHTGTL